jgi:hypothetical protein
MSDQMTTEYFSELLKNNNIDHTKICLVHWTLREEIWNWSEENNITISYMGSLYPVTDAWLILDKKHLMWFKLRWQ